MKVVDWEHHYIPEPHFASLGGVKGISPKNKEACIPNLMNGKFTIFLHDGLWDLDQHIEDMDDAGIDVAVLSYGSAGRTLDEAKVWNEFGAKAIKNYPGRMVALMPLQPVWGQPAFDEIDRAVNELGFSGVQISCQVREHIPLDAPELRPFYKKVTELDVPVFVHVSSAAKGFDALNAEWDSNITLVREYDLSAAVIRIIMGGVLEEFPTLKIVFSHFGGGVSAVWERVERYCTYWGPKFWGWDKDKAPISRPPREYLDMIYFDMAGTEGGINGTKIALTTIKPERLVFGTDYPCEFQEGGEGMREYIKNVRALDLPQEQIDAMLGGNACRLLKINP